MEIYLTYISYMSGEFTKNIGNIETLELYMEEHPDIKKKKS
jgi:hypothetical protein